MHQPGFLECSAQHCRAEGSLSSCLHTQGMLKSQEVRESLPQGSGGWYMCCSEDKLQREWPGRPLCVRCDALKDEGECWTQTVQMFMRMGGQEDGPRGTWQMLLSLWGSCCCFQGPVKQPKPTRRKPLNEICTQVPPACPLLYREPATGTASGL